MSAYERADIDPVEAAKAALESGTAVEAACRIFGPAARRAFRLADLRRILADHDPDAADVAINDFLKRGGSRRGAA